MVAAMPKGGTKKKQEKDFETILGRLNEIVGELEGGERGLEESLKLFEEGVKLSREGHTILDEAENRVQTLTGSGEVVDGVEGGEG